MGYTLPGKNNRPISPQLHLLLPDLFRVHDNVIPSLPAHNTLPLMLARSRRTKSVAGSSAEALLYALLSGQPHPADEAPVAACLYTHHTQKQTDKYCLLLQPVHLEVGRAGLVLTQMDDFDLSADESQALLQAMSDLLNEVGEIVELEPGLWVLLMEHDAGIKTRAPGPLLGQRIDLCLPVGDGAKYWHQLINEVQMLFHHHPVNAERARLGKTLISGIWPWGGGFRPPVKTGVWQGLFSDDAFACGLARYANIPVYPLPENFSQCQAQLAESGRYLVYFPQFKGLGARSPGLWLEQYTKFEQLWCEPLFKALKLRKVTELTVDTGEGLAYKLNTSSVRKWWVRNPSLEKYLEKVS